VFEKRMSEQFVCNCIADRQWTKESWSLKNIFLLSRKLVYNKIYSLSNFDNTIINGTVMRHE